MTGLGVNWRTEIQEQYKGSVADNYIKMIEDFLRESPGDVLREFSSELIINLRSLRNYARRVQENENAQAKSVIVFTTFANGVESDVTLDEFTQSLLEQIAEARHMLDSLKFYSMALLEKEQLQASQPNEEA